MQRQPFTRIQSSYSQVRYLPRLGKIRLGQKVLKASTGNSYPVETPHFVVPPEVAAIYGAEPRELDVMLPHDDPEVIFPQKLARYGSSAGLKCHGDGVTALERGADGISWNQRECPCPALKSDTNPKGECNEQSSLMVLLPRVSLGGCYQITTGSFNNTVLLNSALDYIRAMVGRITLIPLKLRREPFATHHGGKSQTHHTLNLVLDVSLDMLRDLRHDPTAIAIPAQYQIEGPTDENPAMDPPDRVEEDQEADAVKLVQIRQSLANASQPTAPPPADEPGPSAKKRARPQPRQPQVEAPPERAAPEQAAPEQAAPADLAPDADADASMPDATWRTFLIMVETDARWKNILASVLKKMHIGSYEHVPARDRRAVVLTTQDYAKKWNAPITMSID